MDLGRAIKNVRLKKKWSQKDFALKCVITQAYLSQIENNLREPNISTVKKIAKELNIPLAVLFILSMDTTDVDSEKLAVFQKISPSLKKLANKFTEEI